MKFKKTTLPNGLRVITVPMKGNPSVMVMVAVETGSDYESKAENGLSHFLEHMCFKGTVRRPKASDIAAELDGLGAVNNAFTSNEWTSYFAKASKKHFRKLFDIVSDLYLNPTLPAKDLEVERGVILQEISMYEDLPQWKVWEALYKLMYGDTPAGRPILGPKENIRNFTRDNFTNYREKHYVANKTVVVVAGDVSEKEVMKEVEKSFKDIDPRKKISKEKTSYKQKKPALLIEKKKTDQTHLVVSFHAYSAKDKRSMITNIMANILGQGMSSRLWHRLREEMGACYYVRAIVDEYTDHGHFAIATGIEKSRIREVIKVILEECKRLVDIPVDDDELNKAKEYSLGHLYMDLETSDDVAKFYVEQEISTGKIKTPQEIEREIRKITPKDIQKVAQDVFKDENLNLAVVGDISDFEGIKRVLTLK